MSSVALSLPPQIEDAIKDITNDHHSGARQLALKALSALKLATALFPADLSSWPKIVNCAWHITQARPSMKPAIETAILRALNKIAPPTYPSSPTITTTFDTLISEESESLSRLCAHFREFIKEFKVDSILTLSNSSTIFTALKSLFDWSECPKLRLIILESRPLFEGVTLAKSLLPVKPPHVTIHVAVDATVAHYVAQSELVIIGADQVDPLTKNVKNKVGSSAAVRFGKRAICVTSTDKLAPEDTQADYDKQWWQGFVDEGWEENEAGEVMGVWPAGLVEGGEEWVVRNPYFEWVPGEDLLGYLTEDGFLPGGGLESIYRERESWKEVWKILDHVVSDGNKRRRSATDDVSNGNKRKQVSSDK